MIQQANYEFGFEVNDIPLMVEAIPLSSDSIILVITKIEYPEELDTRFSKFSEPDEEHFDEYESDSAARRQYRGRMIFWIFSAKSSRNMRSSLQQVKKKQGSQLAGKKTMLRLKKSRIL